MSRNENARPTLTAKSSGISKPEGIPLDVQRLRMKEVLKTDLGVDEFFRDVRPKLLSSSTRTLSSCGAQLPATRLLFSIAFLYPDDDLD